MLISRYSAVRDPKYKMTLVAPFETQEQVDAYWASRKQEAWKDLNGMGQMILSADDVAGVMRPCEEPAPQPAAAMSAEKPKKSERKVSTAGALIKQLFDTKELKALGITA